MRIWGPAAPRRACLDSSAGAEVPIGGDEAKAAPPPSPVCATWPRRGNKFCQIGECNSLGAGSCFSSCEGLAALPDPAELSEGARRVIRKIDREPLVDLALECPPLRSAADIRAIVVAVSHNSAPLRTLSIGPWGQGSDAGRACGCCTSLDGAEHAEHIVRTFVSMSTEWSRWALKSLTVTDLGVVDPAVLPALLALLPHGVTTLRLVGLTLGPRALLRECVQVLLALDSRINLDLSNNGLGDAHIELLLPLLAGPSAELPESEGAGISVLSMPRLSGLSLAYNPDISRAGLQRLLLGIRSSPAALETLDLSECGIGSEGSQLFANDIGAPGLSALRDLTLYRVGLGGEGICLLVKAAAQLPALRSLNLTANGQHVVNWMSLVGQGVATALSAALSLRVLTISCPEAELESARRFFVGLGVPCRVILVPNEQNNYNRQLFMGHVH